MSAPTPVGFLDFFILEAGEYVEQLDGLLDAGRTAGPDAEALQRIARALRGSATMAKLLPFAEVAGGVERVGRALREGALQWEPGLAGVVVAAVDECKLLLRNVRTWSDVEDARARARSTELANYAAMRSPTPMASPSMQGHDSYLATESSNIGAGLELLATRPADREAAANVLRRVRALRGIASVKDHPALADVLEAAEQAAHPLESGQLTLGAERIALLTEAATVLRAIASGIRAGGEANAPATDLTRFASALEAMQETETGTERVVPISELFYDDGAAGVLETSPNPPTTPAERFRLESVSQGEHLRRLFGDARAAKDPLAQERVRRSLRQALRSLVVSASSFGETAVAQYVASHSESAAELDAEAIDALDRLAVMLAQPGSTSASLTERLAEMQRPPAPVAPQPQVRPAVMTPMSSPSVAPPTTVPQERDRPAAAAVATVAAAMTPAPSALDDLLSAGIAKLGTLPSTPLSAPAVIAEQPPVPIDVLLYRGRAAIERCVQLRDQARSAGGTMEADALNELFDLLDLALTN
jgi:chemotaxis protein histidine kinase CheA